MTRDHRHHRRGISTLWVILALPVFLSLLIFTVDIANLWLARVELENGLEAAALAAVEEWGRGGSGSTQPARQVGVAYARANRVRGVPIAIATNHDPMPGADNPNENLVCCMSADPPSGNLIFGTITEDDPLTFNAGERPGCGAGTVLFDATGSGTGGLGQKNAWGISFQAAPNTPENLLIETIIIDLQAGGGTGTFDFSSSAPAVSDSLPAPIIPCQDDTEGLDYRTDDGDPSQIEFQYSGSHPSMLTIHFRADEGSGDPGFEPGDHFRFGARTSGVGTGGGEEDDGDGVGASGVRVTVIFSIGGVPQEPVHGTFVDTAYKQNDCSDTCPVHPSGIDDLPCPATSAANNDGQSFVLLNGAGQADFAVRAQAIVAVTSLSGRLLGDCFGPFYISARATARYNCSMDRAWLVEVEKFICPGPEE